MKILVEGQFGHGGKRSIYHRIKRKIKKTFRPKLAKSSAPFDWVNDVAMIQARYSKIGPVKLKNQFQSDSCWGQANSYWHGIVKAVNTQNQYLEYSAKSSYAPVAYTGGGTTVASGENYFCNKGINTEAQVPSYVNGTTDETFMTDKSWMTPPNVILASGNSGWVAVSVDIDIDSMACSIRDNIANMWEIEGQNNGTWLSSNPQHPSSNSGLWAHFMCQPLVSVANGVNTIKSLQSWGNVGDNGYQYFDNNYISSGFIIDCFTFVPKMVPHPTIPGQQVPNPVILTWQQRLVNYFLALFQ